MLAHTKVLGGGQQTFLGVAFVSLLRRHSDKGEKVWVETPGEIQMKIARWEKLGGGRFASPVPLFAFGVVPFEDEQFELREEAAL